MTKETFSLLVFSMFLGNELHIEYFICDKEIVLLKRWRTSNKLSRREAIFGTPFD